MTRPHPLRALLPLLSLGMGCAACSGEEGSNATLADLPGLEVMLWIDPAPADTADPPTHAGVTLLYDDESVRAGITDDCALLEAGVQAELAGARLVVEDLGGVNGVTGDGDFPELEGDVRLDGATAELRVDDGTREVVGRYPVEPIAVRSAALTSHDDWTIGREDP